MNQNTCENCTYYRQHYSFDDRKFFRVYFGHCTHHKAKAKRPDAKACENYVQGDCHQNPFVTKEYLSKALLEYILNLELLPEIGDMEDKAT